MDWPQLAQEWDLDVITTLDDNSCSEVLGIPLSLVATSWAGANLAEYVPIVVQQPFTVVKMAVGFGSTVGNVDVGIYDRSGTRLVSSGSTVVSSATIPMAFDITDTTIGPGEYYAAVAHDSTATIYSMSGLTGVLPMLGIYTQATAFPLPATATFATSVARAIFPWVGLFGRTLV